MNLSRKLFSLILGCFFGGEIRWMENFGEKIERKTFLECVWLGGEEGK